MNKRQALKAAEEHIKGQEKQIGDLRYFNRRASADIKAYNKVIDGMIAGESPCPWCEDYVNGECKKPEKGGKGCKEWMLAWEHGEKGEYDGTATETEGILASEGISCASDDRGERTEGPAEKT